MSSRLTVFCCAISALVWVGCGEGGPTLTEAGGTVTYKDAPVAGATVTFHYGDENNTTAVGTTGPDGKFTMLTGSRVGAPIGAASVGITKFASTATGNADPASFKPEDMAEMAKKAQETGGSTTPKNELPEKYADPKKSGLTATVVAGGKDKNAFTFPLTD